MDNLAGQILETYGPELGLFVLALVSVSFMGFMFWKGRSPNDQFGKNAVQRLHELEEAVDKYQRENTELRLSLKEKEWIVRLLESNNQSLPIPMWVKDLQLNMRELNEAYEAMFLRPIGKTREDYVGKSDFDMWPREVALRFRDHDTWVLHSKEGIWFGVETVPDGMGGDIEVYVMKYVRREGGVSLGVSGIAIPSDFFKGDGGLLSLLAAA